MLWAPPVSAHTIDRTIAGPPSGALSLASRFQARRAIFVDLVLVVHGIDRIVLGRHLDADRGRVGIAVCVLGRGQS